LVGDASHGDSGVGDHETEGIAMKELRWWATPATTTIAAPAGTYLDTDAKLSQVEATLQDDASADANVTRNYRWLKTDQLIPAENKHNRFAGRRSIWRHRCSI
jgi:hypothetical protein